MLKVEITPQKVAEITKAGLDINNYWIICSILNDKSNTLFCNTYNLVKEGWLDVNNSLTKKALELINKLEANEEVEKTDWDEIYFKLQKTLVEYHGVKQTKSYGNIYFMMTVKEIEQFLKRFWREYPKYTDLNKIVKIIQNHIISCSKSKKFSPACKYFVLKEVTKGTYTSQLAAIYDSFEEEIKAVEEGSKPKEVKNLF